MQILIHQCLFDLFEIYKSENPVSVHHPYMYNQQTKLCIIM